jgi:hypothetical protein
LTASTNSDLRWQRCQRSGGLFKAVIKTETNEKKRHETD